MMLGIKVDYDSKTWEIERANIAWDACTIRNRYEKTKLVKLSELRNLRTGPLEFCDELTECKWTCEDDALTFIQSVNENCGDSVLRNPSLHRKPGGLPR